MSIIFKDLQFGYAEDGRKILEDFNAEFSKEKITILTGASGCGKSTTLYLAAGIYPRNGGIRTGGGVTVDGISPEELSPKERCRLVGMMFQNPELQFCMDTVKNELIFCLENICMEPEKMDRAVDEALEFCEISHLKERTLLSLSGGERQKVMLSCLTALRPKWLLLDEPFANIDNVSARAIAKKLKELHDAYGMGILAVDHRLDNWLAVADEIQIMEKGKILPEHMKVSELDEAVLEERGIIVPGRSYRSGDGNRHEGARETEHEIDGETGGGTELGTAPALVLKNMTLSYGKNEILKGLNASFYRGRIYAIVGESGCGKSSLFGALSGMNSYKGEALLEGTEIRSRAFRKKHLGTMGFVTQNPQDQFVGGNIRQEILISLRGNPKAEELSEEILRGIKLWRYREVSPYLLSQGQQRRLGVAALMAYDCHILVCDEPTYAQDRNNTLAIMEALCRQARENHAALIFSTHDRQLAKDFADEILELKGGELHAWDQSGL